MNNPNGKEADIFGFIAIIGLLALIGCGVWFGWKYIRHERQEGNATHQLRRIEEEAQKGGWVKDSNGAWILPSVAVTNATGSEAATNIELPHKDAQKK
jgi:predicted negative regulator of RcsB-dependent stress response